MESKKCQPRAGSIGEAMNGHETVIWLFLVFDVLAMASNLIASLLLVAMPRAPSSVLAPSIQ